MCVPCWREARGAKYIRSSGAPESFAESENENGEDRAEDGGLKRQDQPGREVMSGQE